MNVTQKEWEHGMYLDDVTIACSVATTSSSAQYTLPAAGDYYILAAVGATAYLEGGSNPTVTATAGGFAIVVPEGQVIGPVRLKGPKIAHITTGVTGKLVFMHLVTGATMGL